MTGAVTEGTTDGTADGTPGGTAPRRADLLHLSPEALTQAANAGLVKRALRELAAGQGPQTTLAADGTLHAAFADGVACRWPAGASIVQAHCSCGAPGVCRHRVLAALAYREAAAGDVPAPASAVATADEATLARLVPAALLQLAAQQRDAGLSVDVRRRSSGEPCDTARLPSATVRFWAGAALEAARCDCLRAAACEHVALGLWAFRAADVERPDVPALSVRLGAQGHTHALAATPFERLAEALLRHGVARGPAPLVQALTAARAAAADAAWLALLLADIETWCEAYAARSALYEAEQGVDLLAELALRLAAGGQPGQAAPVLGIGQSGETALDRLRLMCLGARTTRDGQARRTTLVLADLDTGTRLVLPHAWQVPQARREDEAALRAAERVAPGVRLEALMKGQLLAQQAARRPDGSVRLARARSAQNSVLPQSADWGMLGPPVRFDSVAALAAEQRAHPNAALQPRHAARRFVVFSPVAVETPVYDANAQCVAALLRDGAGRALRLQRTHEAHVPHALDAVAHALSGKAGPLRHVAGLLSWPQGLPVIEPWALACDGLPVVPDLAAAAGALAALPLGWAPPSQAGPVAQSLARTRALLGELLHHGLAQLPRGWLGHAAALEVDLRAADLRVLAARWQALLPLLTVAQARPDDSPLAPPLLQLLGLWQLHVDAASQSS